MCIGTTDHPTLNVNTKDAISSSLSSATPMMNRINSCLKNSKRRHSQKSVRFEIDDCDQVKTHVKTFERQNAPIWNLWWSKEEMNEILTNVRSLLQRYGGNHVVEDVIRETEGNEEARGLEHHLAAAANRERRVKVIQGVINGQQSLCGMDAEKRARLLGTRYSRMCRPSAAVARTLAERDALDVARQ